jgi:hypothetical protein
MGADVSVKQLVVKVHSKLVAVELIGDTNCYETKTGRMSRHWSAVSICDESSDYRILQMACERAADPCGGMFYLQGRKCTTTPEAYLRAWRRSLVNVLTLEQAYAQHGIRISLCLRVPLKAPAYQQMNLNEDRQAALQECIIKDGGTFERCTQFDIEYAVFAPTVELWKKYANGWGVRPNDLISISGPTY